MDGVDLACCDFSKEINGWSYTMLATVTLPYPAGLREKLKIASTWDSENIRELDTELGKYYGELLNKFHNSHPDWMRTECAPGPGLVESLLPPGMWRLAQLLGRR